MRKSCAGQVEIAISPQFLAIEPCFVRKICAGQVEIALLPQFLAIEPRFVQKVAPDTLKSHFYFSFWRSNVVSCQRVARDDLGIAILPQFLAVEPRFVRKGCVSCCLVGTAPAPAFRREIEEKERERGQEEKM